MPEPTKEERLERAEHDAALVEAQAQEYEDLEALYARVVKAHHADMDAAESLNTRYLSALKRIETLGTIRHWLSPEARIAREALAPDTGTENE